MADKRTSSRITSWDRTRVLLSLISRARDHWAALLAGVTTAIKDVYTNNELSLLFVAKHTFVNAFATLRWVIPTRLKVPLNVRSPNGTNQWLLVSYRPPGTPATPRAIGSRLHRSIPTYKLIRKYKNCECFMNGNRESGMSGKVLHFWQGKKNVKAKRVWNMFHHK